jgi:hypothetical protein
MTDGDLRGDQRTVADALFAIAEGLQEVAQAIRSLGLGDEVSSMGAILGLAMEVRRGFTQLSEATLDASSPAVQDETGEEMAR